jgi:membrane dipeptidase
VLRRSRAPVIASHSSSRALVDNVRNMSDEMIRALARQGGVVMVNFFDAMVNPAYTPEVMAEAVRRAAPAGQLYDLWNLLYAVKRERALPGSTWEDVVDHIDHIAQVAGVEHVGLGSDFDGVFELPGGMEDVTRLPWITYGLLKRGYSEEDLYKMLGGNTLRVLEEAERIAER